MTGTWDNHEVELRYFSFEILRHDGHDTTVAFPVHDWHTELAHVVGGRPPPHRLFLGEERPRLPVAMRSIGIVQGVVTITKHQSKSCCLRVFGPEHTLQNRVVPARRPSCARLVKHERTDLFGRSDGSPHGGNPAERVTDDDRPSPVENGEQIVDVTVDACRFAEIRRPAVPTAVIPEHPAFGGKDVCHARERGATVENTMDKDHEVIARPHLGDLQIHGRAGYPFQGIDFKLSFRLYGAMFHGPIALGPS